MRGVSESCEMKSKISTLLATIKYCCSTTTSGSNGVNNKMPLLLNLKISQMHNISTFLNATLLSKVKHPLIVTLLDCFLVFSHTDTSNNDSNKCDHNTSTHKVPLKVGINNKSSSEFRSESYFKCLNFNSLKLNELLNYSLSMVLSQSKKRQICCRKSVANT